MSKDNIKIIEPEVIPTPVFNIPSNRRIGQNSILPTTVQNRLLTSGGLLPNIFGVGSDGDVIISSNTSLVQDMQYRNLTVNSGVTLTIDGNRIFVYNTLKNSGTIRSVGGNASGGTAGIGATGVHLRGGGNGAAGVSTADDGNSATDPVGHKIGTDSGAGGAGGNAGVQIGGIGGVPASEVGSDFFTDIVSTLAISSPDTVGTASLGGGGGGGSGGNATGVAVTSGGGGGGGGTILISAHILDNINGTISAVGGTGGNASGTGNGGGGGGGGGGIIILLGLTINNGTLVVTGGGGGSGVGTGVAGNTGQNGDTVTVIGA